MKTTRLAFGWRLFIEETCGSSVSHLHSTENMHEWCFARWTRVHKFCAKPEWSRVQKWVFYTNNEGGNCGNISCYIVASEIFHVTYSGIWNISCYIVASERCKSNDHGKIKYNFHVHGENRSEEIQMVCCRFIILHFSLLISWGFASVWPSLSSFRIVFRKCRHTEKHEEVAVKAETCAANLAAPPAAVSEPQICANVWKCVQAKPTVQIQKRVFCTELLGGCGFIQCAVRSLKIHKTCDRTSPRDKSKKYLQYMQPLSSVYAHAHAERANEQYAKVKTSLD